MKEEIVARRYAKALFALGCEANVVESYMAELRKLSEVTTKVPNILTAFMDRDVADAKKQSLVTSLTKELSLSHMVTNFLRFLVKKDRMALLPHIIVAYGKQFEAYERVAVLLVTVADARVAEDVVTRIETIMKDLLHREVRSEVSVQPHVIGGVSVRIGDTVLDGTIRGRLKKMKENFSLKE